MPLIFDSLNLMFLGAVAVFAGGIVKANPDLTGPPDSAYGKWQAKKREKVSHEQSSAGASASLRSTRADDVVRRAARGRAIDPAVSVCPADDAAARVSRRDPGYVAEACVP